MIPLPPTWRPAVLLALIGDVDELGDWERFWLCATARTGWKRFSGGKMMCASCFGVTRAKFCNTSDVGSDGFLVSFGGVSAVVASSAASDALAVLASFSSTGFISISSTDLVGLSLKDRTKKRFNDNNTDRGEGIDLPCP